MPTHQQQLKDAVEVQIKNLVPYKNRTKLPLQEDKVVLAVKRLTEEGWCEALLGRRLPKGKIEILRGHHRVEAARRLGLESAPFIVLEDCDDKKAVELYVRSDNLIDRRSTVFVIDLAMNPPEGYTDKNLAEDLGLN